MYGVIWDNCIVFSWLCFCWHGFNSFDVIICLQRLSEMCCSAVSQLLMLGKSIISSANNTQVEDVDADVENIDWPEDSVEKAKIIRSKAQAMTGYVEAVSSSFITGWYPGALFLCDYAHKWLLFPSCNMPLQFTLLCSKEKYSEITQYLNGRVVSY